MAEKASESATREGREYIAGEWKRHRRELLVLNPTDHSPAQHLTGAIRNWLPLYCCIGAERVHDLFDRRAYSADVGILTPAGGWVEPMTQS